MRTYCTIITPDYLPLAKVLHASIQKYDRGCSFHIFSTGEISAPLPGNMKLVTENEIAADPVFHAIQRKYAHTNTDFYRWALKPVLLSHLSQKGFEKLVFLDPDIFFTGDPGFILQLLDTYSIILTPHWADIDIINNPDSLFSVLRGGLFNGGFMAVTPKALPALSWWAGMCHFKTEKNQELGVYVDQKYLDLFPVQFDDVHILRHQGCNLASWNIQSCKRELVNGELRINGKFDPVFIHFANDTIDNILNRNDQLLKPYLDEYTELLKKEGFDLLGKSRQGMKVRSQSPFYRFKHNIRIRTRLKRWLFKLAEKL